jgi:gamma-glutamyl-gamma-aminobutyraldehyde dehydrogenase
MDVDMVSFTGSTETGRRFLSYAAEANLKEVTLEMGGKNPAIVLDDAENLDRVAAPCGQRRLLEHGRELLRLLAADRAGGVKDALLERLAAHAREWPVGDPLDPETRIGALVSEGAFRQGCSYLGQGP